MTADDGRPDPSTIKRPTTPEIPQAQTPQAQTPQAQAPTPTDPTYLAAPYSGRPPVGYLSEVAAEGPPSAPPVPPPPGFAPPAQAQDDRWGFPASPPPPPPPQAPAGPPTAQPARSRVQARRWAIAGVAVLGVGATVAGVLLADRGASSGPSPQEVVQTYLHDVATGNASAALALGRAPASTKFASATILRAQLAQAPLTAVSVRPASVQGGVANVPATYRIGRRRVSTTYALTKTAGHWRLDRTTFHLDTSDLDGVPEPTLFGQPLAAVSAVDVFPGPLVWGSSNRYFSVRATGYPTSPTDATSDIQLEPALNAAGHHAVTAAIATYLRHCAASHAAQPKHCPQQADDAGIVKGSVRWRRTTPLSALHPKTGDTPTSLQVQGTINWSATFTVRMGKKGRHHVGHEPHVPGYVSGTIDLTRQVPVLAPDS